MQIYLIVLLTFDIDYNCFIVKKQTITMFQNSYQNGTYFEIFDPKISQDKAKNLYKLQNVNGNNKIFDKELKTYVLQFNNPNAKIIFPKEDRKQLYLIQQFLNLQVYFYQGMPWNIQLSISDLNKTKRRIVLSPVNKAENKPFFVKFPCSHVQQGIWTNLTIDLYSFIGAFKGQTYRSLDTITMSGHFKLRRIFSTQDPPPIYSNSQDSKVINLLPKAIYLPVQIQCSNCMITYQQVSIHTQQYQNTQPSVKNKSNILSRKQLSTPKAQTIKSQKKGYKEQKKFLADTNGPQKNRNKRQKGPGQDLSQRYQEKSGSSIEKKNKQVKRQVGKSEVPKARSSIQKRKNMKVEQKSKVKNKLNPWRSEKKNQTHTDGASQLSSTKPLNARKIQSAETTLFKTKNNLASKFNQSNNKGFDHRSDHYSDSDYVQLSQKFSTLTQGKFFKNQLGSQHVQRHEKQNDEIEQNIQMESNSMCESSKRKQQNQLIKQLKNQPIDESISDSLNHLLQKKQQPNMNKNKNNKFSSSGNGIQPSMMSSYYGFGQKIMNKYMNQVQRPYSPPLGDREVTQQISQKNEQEQKQVQLIYDPVLNCYYDHKTHTYYELKN